MLNLSHNKLSCLPIEIGSLKSLTLLHLTHNFLSEIPVTLGTLQDLEEIDVSDNPRLSSLPTEIRELSRIKTIRAARCKLQLGGFPASILTDTPVAVVDLQGNPVTEEGLLRDLEGYAEVKC